MWTQEIKNQQEIFEKKSLAKIKERRRSNYQTQQQFGRIKEKNSILKMVLAVGLIFLPKVVATLNDPQPQSPTHRTVAIVMGIVGSVLALGTLTTLVIVCCVKSKNYTECD